MPSTRSRVKVDNLVQDVVAQGASLTLGGHAVRERGYFYAPTVITDVAPTARILSEEIFGPVAPVTTFGSEDEAV